MPGPPSCTTTSPTTWPAASRWPRGDVAAALAAAPRVAQRAPRHRALGGGQPMETRGHRRRAQRRWRASSPCGRRRRCRTRCGSSSASCSGLPPHQVRVIAPDMGGGFGAKLIVYPEDVLVPLLAVRTGRPVRWLEGRNEHMLTATQERTQVHEVTVGFDADGRLLALRDRFVHDTGAYTPRGPGGAAPDRVDAHRAVSHPGRGGALFDSVYTHRVPVTPYRGAGQPQAVFVIERVLDLVARATGRDRAAVRLANLVPPEAMPYDVGLDQLPELGPRGPGQRRSSPRCCGARSRCPAGSGFDRRARPRRGTRGPASRRRHRLLRGADRCRAVRGRDGARGRGRAHHRVHRAPARRGRGSRPRSRRSRRTSSA